MEPNKDAPEVLETPETTETPEGETPELTAEQIAELKAKAAKAEELENKNKQLFERAKKAEELAKVQKEPDSLSNKDLLFLAKADIHTEDVDDVLEWAKFKKVSVEEAYKHMKPQLDVRAEERRTAQATQAKGSPRGAAKVTGEDILKKAEKTGEIPETPEGIAALAEARMARRKAALSR